MRLKTKDLIRNIVRYLCLPSVISLQRFGLQLRSKEWPVQNLKINFHLSERLIIPYSLFAL